MTIIFNNDAHSFPWAHSSSKSPNARERYSKRQEELLFFVSLQFQADQHIVANSGTRQTRDHSLPGPQTASPGLVIAIGHLSKLLILRDSSILLFTGYGYYNTKSPKFKYRRNSHKFKTLRKLCLNCGMEFAVDPNCIVSLYKRPNTIVFKAVLFCGLADCCFPVKSSPIIIC